MDPDTSAPSTQQGMRFDVQGKNTAGESIKNVFINVNFGNNTGFAYDGINLKSRINSIDVTNPLPASIYSAANGITAEITSAGTPTAEDTQGIRLAPVSAAQNISILPNINTYQNNVSVSITALTTATDTPVSSPAFNFTIYANVKPHVTDMYFEYADGSNTTSTVQGAGAEAINLVVKVKDSNGSDNIAGGSVKADLSALGLGSAETLSYVSSSGNTATFKKTGIVTSASLGEKTIPINGVIATDVDGHTNDITDPYFASADHKSDLTLTIVAPAAPTVSLVSVSDNQIGGPLEPSSTVVFSSNQNGETKVVIGGDSLCSSGGTILEDWTGSGSYTSGSQKSITINATSLASGANTVNLCMRNTGLVAGSIGTTITKNTTAPVLSGLTYGPTNVTTSDASVTFSCNAISESRLELGGSTYGAGTFVASGSTVAGGSSTLPISNTLLSNGSNVFKAYCRDGFGNTSSGSTVTINKTPPTPAMTGTALLADNDIDIDGLDGRDVSITWDTSA